MDVKDEHFCVLCCTTIHGLMEYVKHRQNGCEIQNMSKTEVSSNPETESFMENLKQEPTEAIINQTCQSIDDNGVVGARCHSNNPNEQPSKTSVDLAGPSTLISDPTIKRLLKTVNTGMMTVKNEDTGTSKKNNFGLLSSNININKKGTKANSKLVLSRKEKEGKQPSKPSEKCLTPIKRNDHTYHTKDSHNLRSAAKSQQITNNKSCGSRKVPDTSTQPIYINNVYFVKRDKQLKLSETVDSLSRENTTISSKIEISNDVNEVRARSKNVENTNERTMSVHEKHVESINSGTLTCSKCRQILETGDLLKHSCHAIDEEKGATYKTLGNLAVKEDNVSQLGQFHCSLCQFHVDMYDDFKSHINSTDHVHKAENIQTVFLCRQCDVKFSEHGDLEHHVLNVQQDRNADTVHVISVIPMDDQESMNSLPMHDIEQNKNDNGDLEQLNEQTKTESDDTADATNTHIENDGDGTDELDTQTNVQTDSDHDDNESADKVDAGIDQVDTNIDTVDACINSVIEQSRTDSDKTEEVEQTSTDTDDIEVKYMVDSDAVRFDDEAFTEIKKPNNKRRKGNPENSKANKCKRRKMECKYCTFVSDVDSDIKFHYLDEHLELIYKCDVCDIVFITSGNYAKHANSKEHQAKVAELGEDKLSQEFYQCEVCDKKFTSENYCKYHTALHHFHLHSEECLLQYPSITRDRFADYLVTLENESSRARCKCPDCGAVVSKSNMMAHLRKHTGESPFQCKLCDDNFVNQTSLRRHLGVHFNIFSKKCSICGQEFKRVEYYNNHLNLHKAKAVDSKAHVCEVCGKSFYLAKQLRAHLYKHREKKLKCDHPGCQWSFHHKHDLDMHKLTHSSDGNAFICATCGYTAKCKKYLKAHEKIHSKDVELLQCQYCDYKARKNTHMRRHTRIHLGSKPYKCPYCTYACNTHDNIRKHILETSIHLGLKVYPCKFCDYATNSTKDFRGHLMSDHSDLVDDGARNKSLSSFTGLFVENEDLSVPAEGTVIVPVIKRKNSRRSFNTEPENEMTD